MSENIKESRTALPSEAKNSFRQEAERMYEALVDKYLPQVHDFSMSLVKAPSKEEAMIIMNKFIKDFVIKQNVIMRYDTARILGNASVRNALLKLGFTDEELDEKRYDMSFLHNCIQEQLAHDNLTCISSAENFEALLRNLEHRQYWEDRMRDLK